MGPARGTDRQWQLFALWHPRCKGEGGEDAVNAIASSAVARPVLGQGGEANVTKVLDVAGPALPRKEVRNVSVAVA